MVIAHAVMETAQCNVHWFVLNFSFLFDSFGIIYILVYYIGSIKVRRTAFTSSLIIHH